MPETLEELQDRYDDLHDRRQEMADHGRYWTYQPELVEEDYAMKQAMEEIRRKIADLKALAPPDDGRDS